MFNNFKKTHKLNIVFFNEFIGHKKKPLVQAVFINYAS